MQKTKIETLESKVKELLAEIANLKTQVASPSDNALSAEVKEEEDNNYV